MIGLLLEYSVLYFYSSDDARLYDIQSYICSLPSAIMPIVLSLSFSAMRPIVTKASLYYIAFAAR